MQVPDVEVAQALSAVLGLINLPLSALTQPLLLPHKPFHFLLRGGGILTFLS